jgi:hypothetical protein
MILRSTPETPIVNRLHERGHKVSPFIIQGMLLWRGGGDSRMGKEGWRTIWVFESQSSILPSLVDDYSEIWEWGLCNSPPWRWWWLTECGVPIVAPCVALATTNAWSWAICTNCVACAFKAFNVAYFLALFVHILATSSTTIGSFRCASSCSRLSYIHYLTIGHVTCASWPIRNVFYAISLYLLIRDFGKFQNKCEWFNF